MYLVMGCRMVKVWCLRVLFGRLCFLGRKILAIMMERVISQLSPANIFRNIDHLLRISRPWKRLFRKCLLSVSRLPNLLLARRSRKSLKYHINRKSKYASSSTNTTPRSSNFSVKKRHRSTNTEEN